MIPRRRVGLVLGEGQLGVGGVRSVCEALSQELALAGADVEWLSLERSADVRAVRSIDAHEGAWPLRRVIAPPALTFDELDSAPRLESAVLAWCAARGVDLVHLQHLSGWGLGLPGRLARRAQPVVWTLHDYWPLCARGQLWHVDGQACERVDASVCGDCVARTWPGLGDAAAARAFSGARLERAVRAIEACTRVLVPSAGARDVWLRHGVAPDRLEICGTPMRPALCAGARRKLEHGDIRVGVLGSVQPSKGVLELARTIDELGAPFTLEVHGPREGYHGDRSYAQALEALAARSERVELFERFAPRELGARLAGLDLVAVPSLWEEVFGLVAREAQAFGLPVFVSDHGGLVEAGAHVVAHGPRGWREALERFALDAEWRGRLSPVGGQGRPAVDVARLLLELEVRSASARA